MVIKSYEAKLPIGSDCSLPRVFIKIGAGSKAKESNSGKEGPARKMYYVSILKNNNGKLEIGYSETNPEYSNEEQEVVYYETYKEKKEAIHRKSSLLLYGNAWAQLKRRIKKSLG